MRGGGEPVSGMLCTMSCLFSISRLASMNSSKRGQFHRHEVALDRALLCSTLYECHGEASSLHFSRCTLARMRANCAEHKGSCIRAVSQVLTWPRLHGPCKSRATRCQALTGTDPSTTGEGEEDSRDTQHTASSLPLL